MNPTLEHIIRVGEEFQIRKNEVIEIAGTVSEAVGNWNEFAREAGVPTQVSDRIRSKFVPLKRAPKIPSPSARKRVE